MDRQRVTTSVTVVLAAVIAICLSTGMVVAAPDRLPLGSSHIEDADKDQSTYIPRDLESANSSHVATSSTGDVPTKIVDVTYDGDKNTSINEIIATEDGNYLLVGVKLVENKADPSVKKVAADGSVLWERTYTDDSNQSFTSVIQTGTGNFVLSGATETTDSYTGWGVKIATDGTKLWEIQDGSSEGIFRDVEKTADNRYLFVGQHNSSEGDTNAEVLKTTADGTEAWNFIYWHQSERNEQGFDGIERIGSDTFALAGDAYVDDEQWDGWAFEIDSDGEILTSEVYGHSVLNDFFNDVTVTRGGTPVYVGFRNGNFDSSVGEYTSRDAWIYYDNSSDGEWSKDVNVNNLNVFRSVSTDGGRIVAAGASAPEEDANRNKLAVEYNTKGTQNWLLNVDKAGDQSIDRVFVRGNNTYLSGEEQAPDEDTYDGKLFRYASDSSGGDDDDSSTPADPISGDGSIVSTDRTVDSLKAVAGDTVTVTVTATFNGTVNDAQINDQISPALPATQVEITDSGGASVAAYQELTGIVTANYGDVSDVTLSYEVTVPDDVSAGTTYEFTGGEVRNRDIGAVSTIAGDSSIEVITNPLLRYAGPSGVVGPGGLGDAAAAFRSGEIGPGTLGEVAAAFRSGEPVV